MSELILRGLRLTFAGVGARARLWLAIAALFLVTISALGLYLWRAGARPEDLAALGYPGIALVMLLSGGGIFFPAAGQATVMVAGALWHPALVGLAAGLGNATGELTGYAAGRIGAAALHGRRAPRWWSRLHAWLDRYGFLAILAMALVPNPLFDVIGVLAGSLGYPVRRFWLACLIGNSAKYAALAYLGGAARWLLR